MTFIDGIICIWILKLVIEHGYEHRVYISYILVRLISITVLASLISGISISSFIHIPSKRDSQQDVLYYYYILTICLALLLLVYIILSSIIYSFHMLVVKEFYRIVGIIIEAHLYQRKEDDQEMIGQPIPHFCIGVPFFESEKTKCTLVFTIVLIYFFSSRNRRK